MKENTFKTIKHWDEDLMYKYVHKELDSLYSIFEEFGIKKLSFIDVGGNVGKFYEEISKRYIVNKCVIVEASKILSEYMVEKFKNDPRVVVHNFGLSDEGGDFYFDDVGVRCIEDNDIDASKNDINLGLSGKTNVPGSTKFFNASYFLREINNIPDNEITFIKIDTENNDYQIVNAMKDFLLERRINPIILFENNFHNCGKNIEWANELIKSFCEKCGYIQPTLDSENIFLIPNK